MPICAPAQGSAISRLGGGRSKKDEEYEDSVDDDLILETTQKEDHDHEHFEQYPRSAPVSH